MAKDDEAQDAKSYFVRTAARTLSVIRSFDAEHAEQSLSDVARRAELDRATARRLLLTLRDLGYVREDARTFALTPRVLELGFGYLSGATLVEVARPHLQRLADELKETASLTVLDGEEIVYLDLVSSSRIAALRIAIGTRFAAHATSMGRVLLGALPDEELTERLMAATSGSRSERLVRSPEELREQIVAARDQGWALVDQELESGLVGVAVPIVAADGSAVAAVNVSAHGGRLSGEVLVDTYVPRLREAAAAIARDNVTP